MCYQGLLVLIIMASLNTFLQFKQETCYVINIISAYLTVLKSTVKEYKPLVSL